MKLPIYSLWRIIAGRPLFYRINLIIFRLGLTGLGILNYKSMSASGESYFISKLLPRMTGSMALTVVDAGAHHGDYSLAILNQFPNAKIYAFEPNTANYDVLVTKVGERVNCKKAALGHVEGEIDLFDYSDAYGSPHATHYEGVLPTLHGRSGRAERVEVVTLDNIVSQLGIEFIDFLKIDTEGNELNILRGASNLISSGKIQVIQFEFNEMNVFSRVFLKDILDVLKEYKVYRVLPYGLLPINTYRPLLHEIYAYQNYVAVHQDYSD